METAAFGLLVGKGLGRPDTGQAAFNLLVDMANLFLGRGRGTAHPLAHGHNHRQEHRNGQRHHQRQLPPDGDHHNQCAADGQHRGQQIFRAMVGQLRQFKQITGQTGHQLAGSVLIIEVEAQFLHVGKQILADIRFHTDAKGMAVVGHNEIQDRPEHIAAYHHRHNGEEGTVHPVWQQVIQGASGNQRKRQVNGRNAYGTADVQGKQLFVVFKILQKNQRRRFFPIIFRCHSNPPFFPFIILIFKKESTLMLPKL